MDIVTDASAIIAVVVNEPSKPGIVQATQGASLLAPLSVHWEMANAFSAMLKRHRVTLDEALAAIDAYEQIAIRFVDVELKESLQIAHRFNIYAYDAYLLRCAQKLKAPLLSLDVSLLKHARTLNLQVVEI